ncbi:MAG: hypothetical protein Q9M91_03275 [Candidatus Dojkabacteria bacterium]|nr:hypothetical protein [Candidatus Dojkabacteria bacterium]MDQ7020845.1 hypothetical protein [Candidatus Dojkabacteria bacterium]
MLINTDEQNQSSVWDTSESKDLYSTLQHEVGVGSFEDTDEALSFINISESTRDRVLHLLISDCQAKYYMNGAENNFTGNKSIERVISAYSTYKRAGGQKIISSIEQLINES